MNGVQKNMITRKREEFVIKLRCKGYTERRIAEEIGKSNLGPLSQPAVHKIIKRVEARVLKATTLDLEALKVKHTLILEQNIEDLRDAYDKSTQAQVFQKKKTGGKAPPPKKGTGNDGGAAPAAVIAFEQNEVGQKTQIGDHSILRELRETLGDVREIWGAN